MKILFLSWNFPPTLGGIEYVAANLFEGLRRRGHDVRVISGFAAEPDRDDAISRAARKGLAAYLAHSVWLGLALARRFRPDVLLCGSVVSAPGGWLISRAFRRPLVVLAHGSDVLHPGRVYQRAARWLFSRAAVVCANSEQTRLLLTGAGLDVARIHVVYPGVRVADFEREPPRGGSDPLAGWEGRRVLLTVGRLIRRKGVLEFVEHVMPPLVRRFPDLAYAVVGDDATASLAHRERLRERIRRSVEALGLQDHVRLLGSVEAADLLRLYRRADIFVLPCLNIPGDVEGFGIVFSEAALAGAPAVAARVGGIPEAVEDGKTGCLVEPGDYAAYVRVISGLLDEPQRRRGMAEAAAERARQLFDWEVIVGRYEEVLRAAIGQPGPRSRRPQETRSPAGPQPEKISRGGAEFAERGDSI